MCNIKNKYEWNKFSECNCKKNVTKPLLSKIITFMYNGYSCMKGVFFFVCLKFGVVLKQTALNNG